MRFIGNKKKLLDWIYETVQEADVKGDTFFDFFSGTTNVGRYFKDKGYRILSSDLLYFSYVLQKAYIENNKKPEFKNLLPNIETHHNNLFPEPLDFVLSHLNKIEPREGFIYNHYCPGGTENLDRPRKYFTDENAKKIDAIRIQIEEWAKSDQITDNEYFILLTSLIESVPYYANITGVYAAFYKDWDPRALNTFEMRQIELHESDKNHKVHNLDSVELVQDQKCDVLYIDPPYNSRQYAPNYHLLETIAKYDDPEVRGVTGLRDYQDQKSNFCNQARALDELEYIVNNMDTRAIFLSYNTEGLMPHEDIMEIFSQVGDPEVIDRSHPRFKSNSRSGVNYKKYIKEKIYVVKKNHEMSSSSGNRSSMSLSSSSSRT